MVKFFTQTCPTSPCRVQSSSFRQSSPYCLHFVKGQFVPYVIHTRMQEKQSPDIEEPLREETIESIKMPGFIYPDHKYEEGCFTQKAKTQFEELKKKNDNPKVESAQKKE
ncbi:unnamed protein product [Parnassius apollo]|uniref:(apollo) hypothetical protein n=1 Tax=Parnassius apollo TaxID=110799 RepID=A0A8S3Y5Q5_PARAO|nr:unnamed protein product [Parnassius apollo]